MNNITPSSSSYSSSLSIQTSNSSNNSISQKDENPKNSKKQKLRQEIQNFFSLIMGPKKTLFETTTEKFTINSIYHIFENLVVFDTNGFDRACVQGPPENCLYMYKKNFSPEIIARFAPPQAGTNSKHLFIDAKIDSERSIIWLSDSKGNQVFRIDYFHEILVDTFGKQFFAGLKDGTPALFNEPSGLAILTNGNALLCDLGNKSIRTIDITTNEVTTLQTTGSDNKPFAFRGPSFLVANKDNTFAYVSDITRIVSVQLNTGKCTILAGSDNEGNLDAIGNEALFKQLSCIAIDNHNNLLLIDSGNELLRLVHNSTREVQTLNVPHPTTKTNYKFKDITSIQIDPLNGQLNIVGREIGFLRHFIPGIKGKFEFKLNALAFSIRAIGYTRQVLNQKDDNKALHKIIMRTFVSFLSPTQFEQVYYLGINLIKVSNRREIIKDLIIPNDSLKKET